MAIVIQQVLGRSPQRVSHPFSKRGSKVFRECDVPLGDHKADDNFASEVLGQADGSSS